MNRPSSAHAAHSADSGFSLLEILVALAVLGLVITVLTGGTRFGFLAQRKQDDMLNGAPVLESADRALRGIVRTMRPGLPASSNGIAVLPYGTGTALSFIAQLPDDAGSPVRSDVTLLLRNGALLLRWARHINGQPLRTPPWRETVLLPSVLAIAITYEDMQGQWHERWEGPAIPNLIRFRLHLMKNTAGNDTAPDSIVTCAPRIDTERP